MLNIHKLERKWLTYKIKSFIPYVMIVISIIIILITIFIFLENKPKTDVTPNSVPDKTPKIVLAKTTKVIDLETKSVTQKESIPTVVNPQPEEKIPPAIKSEKTTMTPSFNFLNKLQDKRVQKHTPKQLSPQKIVSINKATPVLSPKKEPVTPPKPIDKTKEKEISTSINISTRNTYTDIDDVIKRFHKNNNPALSLFIAKKYYELGDYRKSYNYSLITNEINNNIEESWIIFAKSLVKLDKKDVAIKVLKEYIKHSRSNRAMLLLDRIESGKYK